MKVHKMVCIDVDIVAQLKGQNVSELVNNLLSAYLMKNMNQIEIDEQLSKQMEVIKRIEEKKKELKELEKKSKEEQELKDKMEEQEYLKEKEEKKKTYVSDWFKKSSDIPTDLYLEIIHLKPWDNKYELENYLNTRKDLEFINNQGEWIWKLKAKKSQP